MILFSSVKVKKNKPFLFPGKLISILLILDLLLIIPVLLSAKLSYSFINFSIASCLLLSFFF